ncbi:MAG: hypothetical protein ABIH11_01755 [Candidatus Altiarchaeota archaeon]
MTGKKAKNAGKGFSARGKGIAHRRLAYAIIVIIAYSLPAYLLYENYSKNDKSSMDGGWGYGTGVFEALDEDALILSRWSAYTLLNHFKYVVYDRGDVTILSRRKIDWLKEVDRNYGEKPVYLTEMDDKVSEKYVLERVGGIYHVKKRK